MFFKRLLSNRIFLLIFLWACPRGQRTKCPGREGRLSSLASR